MDPTAHPGQALSPAPSAGWQQGDMCQLGDVHGHGLSCTLVLMKSVCYTGIQQWSIGAQLSDNPKFEEVIA